MTNENRTAKWNIRRRNKNSGSEDGEVRRNTKKTQEGGGGMNNWPVFLLRRIPTILKSSGKMKLLYNNEQLTSHQRRALGFSSGDDEEKSEHDRDFCRHGGAVVGGGRGGVNINLTPGQSHHVPTNILRVKEFGLASLVNETLGDIFVDLAASHAKSLEHIEVIDDDDLTDDASGEESYRQPRIPEVELAAIINETLGDLGCVGKSRR
mmetsp:Transcript_37743/g.53243  ORF Transcript_37743/g.53243 Transcript_37743/m.53243 type:complete len:208 (+) Transcript_37743:62-685(+)